MSYDFTVDSPPHQPYSDGQELADWASEMFQRIENNLLTQRNGWQILPMPVLSENASGISVPNVVKVTDDGAGSSGVYAFSFVRNREESLSIVGATPLALTPGSDIYARLRWAPSTAGSGNVVWAIESTTANVGAVIGNTVIRRVIAPTNSIDRQVLVAQYDMGIDVPYNQGSGLTVLSRIFRDYSHPSDNYSGSAFFLGAQAYINVAAHGNDDIAPPSLLEPGQIWLAT